MASEILIEDARRFFSGMQEATALRPHLQGVSLAVQFAPTDGSPFNVHFEEGRVRCDSGEKYAEGAAEAVHVAGDGAAIAALLHGDISLADSIFDQKIRIASYRNKEPQIVLLSRLLRLGLWAVVPGAKLSMPER